MKSPGRSGRSKKRCSTWRKSCIQRSTQQHSSRMFMPVCRHHFFKIHLYVLVDQQCIQAPLRHRAAVVWIDESQGRFFFSFFFLLLLFYFFFYFFYFFWPARGCARPRPPPPPPGSATDGRSKEAFWTKFLNVFWLNPWWPLMPVGKSWRLEVLHFCVPRVPLMRMALICKTIFRFW